LVGLVAARFGLGVALGCPALQPIMVLLVALTLLREAKRRG
jgi:hypothetical protein